MFRKIKNRKYFEQIYRENTIVGGWRKRNHKEKTKIFRNYIVLDIKGDILGGYSLSNYKINGKKGKILECLFSTKRGVGIGYTLGEEIKKENKPIFAYTKKGGFFEKLGFKKVKGIKSETGADLYVLSS